MDFDLEHIYRNMQILLANNFFKEIVTVYFKCKLFQSLVSKVVKTGRFITRSVASTTKLLHSIST